MDRALISLASERSEDAAGEGKPDPIRKLLVVECANLPVAVIDPGGF
jgi:hypothetical protein